MRRKRLSLDIWLYGDLSKYGRDSKKRSFSNVKVHLPQGSTMADLLLSLGIKREERGITFINGKLSAMPGLQPDMGHILHEGDRVAFFDLKSMWPFQYRHGAALTEEMIHAMGNAEDHGIHHTYTKESH